MKLFLRILLLFSIPLHAAANLISPDETPRFRNGTTLWLNSSLLYSGFTSGSSCSPSGRSLSGRLAVDLRLNPWISLTVAGSSSTVLQNTVPRLTADITNRQIQQLRFDALYGGLTVTGPAHNTWLFTMRMLLGRAYASYSSAQNLVLPADSSPGRGTAFTLDFGVTFFLNRSCTFGWEAGFSYTLIKIDLDRTVYGIDGSPLPESISSQQTGFYTGFTMKL